MPIKFVKRTSKNHIISKNSVLKFRIFSNSEKKNSVTFRDKKIHKAHKGEDP